MDTYDGCCGSCKWLNTNDYCGTKDRCKCTLRGGYHDLHESKCYKHEYDPYKDYYDLNHRWYIVTAIFNKLGLSDDYECISLLHNFRKNVLSKDSRYDAMLAEYDIVGPKIAKLLKEDSESVEICQKLLQVYLVRVLDYIRDKKYDDALNLYIEMVNFLKLIYEVTDNKDAEDKKQNKKNTWFIYKIRVYLYRYWFVVCGYLCPKLRFGE